MMSAITESGGFGNGKSIEEKIEELDKPYTDESVLRELYLNRELTTREIGDIVGSTGSTVSRWLDKHGIPARENWKAGVEAAVESNKNGYASHNIHESGYEYWYSKEGEDRTSRMVYVHRLLAVAEHGFDAVCDMDVHHDNGVKWDNRPDNIRIVSKQEHAQIEDRTRITDEELLDEIRRLADVVGGRQTCRDLQNEGAYSHPTYQERFGGWDEALELAGVVEDES